MRKFPEHPSDDAFPKSSFSFTFVRISLGTCLLLYGCERNKIIESEMITEDEIKSLPSRCVLGFISSIALVLKPAQEEIQYPRQHSFRSNRH